ncbi:MAG: EAL domain-containing protein [Thioalkalispiraceae bacterium]|jgi:diguanylate cyclase (GGDEF)-like protein/PAS domain S-box-containing protein
MKLPDLKASYEPVALSGTLEDYLASLAPFQHYSTTLGVFGRDGTLRFQNEACRYLLEDSSDSIDALYRKQSLSAAPAFRVHLQACLESGKTQTALINVFFDRNISVELNLQFRPLLANSKVAGCLFTIGEESISFHHHHLASMQETLRTYREQISRVTAKKIKSDAFVHALLRSTPFPVMLLNHKRQVMQINEACERLFGLESRQAMAESCEQFIDCYHKQNACPLLDQHREIELEAGSCLVNQPNETHILRSAVLLTEKDEPIILEAFVDITDRYRAEQELKQANQQNRLLLESTSEGIFGIDRHLRFTFVNHAAAEMFGYNAEDLLGREMHDFIHCADENGMSIREEDMAIYHTLKYGKKRSTDAVFTARNAQPIPIQYSSSPVFENNLLTGAVVVFRNVAEQRALNKKMEYMATHDSLTGLLNRNEFERLLKEQISLCRKRHQVAALSYIDLDQFKLVNDTCGHAAGDALLRQLTSVLQNNMREQDYLARLGGDEFGILYCDCDTDTAMRLTQEVCKIIEEFRFIWEGKSFSTKASAGVALIDDSIEDDSSLMSDADSACYIAKESGRNTVHLYENHDEAVTKRKSEMIWVTRLNEALLRNQFELYFQPIVHRGDSDCCRFIEFLVRLHQPDYSEDDNITLPGAFIPAAERYDLMPQVDRWVTKHAIEWIVKHNGSNPQLELCSINLSGHTIGNTEFAKFIEDQFCAHPNIAHKICFEITETAAVADLKRAIDFIEFIKSFGCLFALDDFGSGMSSFSYLKNLPVDFLKIDGTFVRDMAADRVDFAMVEAINQVGQVMGIKTIAEFVENQSIVNQLYMIGVDYMQGHHLARPQPISQFSSQSLTFSNSGNT